MSRIRADNITNRMANGAPTAPNGLVVSGVTTVTTLDLNGDLDVDGHLNADNVSIAGVATATTVSATTGTFDDFVDVGSNIKIGNAGVITATSFSGSGANLTGIDATAIKDSGGNVKIQAEASGAMYTGIHTFGSRMTVTTATSNPSGAVAGDLYFNTNDNVLKVYTGNAWLLAAGSGSVQGGNEQTYSQGGVNYKSHIITTSGIVTVTGQALEVDYLIVAGGGGGGCLGGGGGAGGVLTGTGKELATGNYSITIGGGGLTGGDAQPGATGGNTTAFGLTALGGGGGGSHDGGGISVSGTSGGSGGGGSDNNNSYGPGSGTSGQGNDGGNGVPSFASNERGGGGGGGAGERGHHYNESESGNLGNGGQGIQNSYADGTNYYYAGGGGRSNYAGDSSNHAGDGGAGGGGGGATGNGGGNIGQAGAASYGGNVGSDGSGASQQQGGAGGQNTGGGAGGNGWSRSGGNSGGSGVVVIRYPV